MAGLTWETEHIRQVNYESGRTWLTLANPAHQMQRLPNVLERPLIPRPPGTEPAEHFDRGRPFWNTKLEETLLPVRCANLTLLPLAVPAGNGARQCCYEAQRSARSRHFQRR